MHSKVEEVKQTSVTNQGVAVAALGTSEEEASAD